MNAKLSFVIAGVALFGGSILRHSGEPAVSDTGRKANRPQPSGVHGIRRPAEIAAVQQDTRTNPWPDEAASLATWQARYSALVAECERPGEAAARLITEVDQRYHEWVGAEVAALADLPLRERYDRLAAIEEEIREGSAAILEHLGIEGARRLSVLSASLEAVSAEVQYAERGRNHGQRLAMLRLDREREDRFSNLIALNGPGMDADRLTRTEIDPWYDSQLRVIIGSNQRN